MGYVVIAAATVSRSAVASLLLDPGGSSKLTNPIELGRSFLQVAKLGGGAKVKSVPLQGKSPLQINGQMGFVFTDQETKILADDLKFALVLKFLIARPNIDKIRRVEIKLWG